MIIEIDNREPIIIKEYFSKSINSSNNIITTRLKNLEQGDFIIRDQDENILLIIERKTISDLLSSVKDSRYTEQSDRYSQLDIPSSKIIYLIEGNEKYNLAVGIELGYLKKNYQIILTMVQMIQHLI